MSLPCWSIPYWSHLCSFTTTQDQWNYCCCNLSLHVFSNSSPFNLSFLVCLKTLAQIILENCVLCVNCVVDRFSKFRTLICPDNLDRNPTNWLKNQTASFLLTQNEHLEGLSHITWTCELGPHITPSEHLVKIVQYMRFQCMVDIISHIRYMKFPCSHFC